MKKVVWIVVLALIIGCGIGWLAWRTTGHTPNLPSPPLKVLAARQGIQLGNYASLKRLDDAPYTNILTSQFASATVDGELNWSFNDGELRPAPDSYNFKKPDKVFAFAHQQNLPVQAHHLVWGEEKWLPAWLKNGHYSKDQLLELMHQHIQTVAGHYRGQVREWSVVNEPFTRQLHTFGLHDWWADHVGSQEYIDKAFTWAHEADPNAKLLLNDFNDEGLNQVSDTTYNYIKGMKERGVPIDGVGLQMHIGGDVVPTKEEVIKNMQRFAALGVSVYVTEFDVNMQFVKGTEPERLQKEAAIYHDMVAACVQSKVCHSFAFLGITDMESWYVDLGLKQSEPLMFDHLYQPKPAFFAVRNALSGN